MKAVLLAAGMGVRLQPLTYDIPKCLIRIGNKTLLEHTLENISTIDINEVIIVTGYLSQMIEQAISHINLPISVTFVKNEDFETTGSMYSLYTAKDVIDQDIILFESDLLYEPSALQTILNSKHKTGFLVTSRSFSRDEVFICTDMNDRVIDLGKNLPEKKRNQAIGELVGISKYSLTFLNHLFQFAEKRFKEGVLLDHYEETTFFCSSAELPVFVIFHPFLHWIEIDKEEDLFRAKMFIYPNIKGNTMKIKRNILLNPGPLTTTDSVKFSQVVSDICPREREFGELMKSIQADLTKIAGGNEKYTTVLIAGSGTASVEATISSVVPEDTKLLVINNGAYGQRIIEIAKAYGIETVELKYKYGNPPDIGEMEEILSNDTSVSSIAMVHHETTTGLLNPLSEVGSLAKKYDKLLIIDAISSFAGIPFSISENNVDFMISSSNKCIQGVPGCSFIICKISELEKSKNIRRSVYFHLFDQYDFMINHLQMRFTPPVQVLYALRQAIDEFFEEGAENRYKRYCANNKVLTDGMLELGFQPYLPNAPQSRLLTTYYEPKHPNFSFNKMHDLLYERGFTIYPGKLANMDTFRVANMGALIKTDILNYIDNLKEVLKELKIDHLE